MTCAIGLWALLMFPPDGGSAIVQGCFPSGIACQYEMFHHHRNVIRNRETGAAAFPTYKCEEVASDAK
jgi:hypothetical protein